MNFLADDGMFINPMTIDQQIELGVINIDEFFNVIVGKIQSELKTESIISLIKLMPVVKTYTDANNCNLLDYARLVNNEELEKYLIDATEG